MLGINEDVPSACVLSALFTSVASVVAFQDKLNGNKRPTSAGSRLCSAISLVVSDFLETVNPHLKSKIRRRKTYSCKDIKDVK